MSKATRNSLPNTPKTNTDLPPNNGDGDQTLVQKIGEKASELSSAGIEAVKNNPKTTAAVATGVAAAVAGTAYGIAKAKSADDE